MSKPIEAKVQAGSLSAAASGVILWLLAQYVFKGSMPQGIESLVYAAVPAVLAGVGGYLAPHTPRPDLNPAPRANDLVEQFNDPKLTSTDKGPT